MWFLSRFLSSVGALTVPFVTLGHPMSLYTTDNIQETPHSMQISLLYIWEIKTTSRAPWCYCNTSPGGQTMFVTQRPFWAEVNKDNGTSTVFICSHGRLLDRRRQWDMQQTSSSPSRRLFSPIQSLTPSQFFLTLPLYYTPVFTLLTRSLQPTKCSVLFIPLSDGCCVGWVEHKPAVRKKRGDDWCFTRARVG